ncbi:MAG: hypothetical protein CMA64_00980 [Euryarchaeota archaeon]|nr:hypothetical protein [Euryarchaeota archaeon]
MIVGLVGFIGSGKDTVAKQFESRGFARDSFAAPLKDAVSSIFNWPREMLEGDSDKSRAFREMRDTWWSSKLEDKQFTPRWALQYIGTEILRDQFNHNIWLHSLENRYMATGRKQTVVSDCRFKNEVGLIKTLGGYVVRVKRGNEPHWYEMAQEAATGDKFAQHSLYEMGVHQSEWDWVNTRVDFTVDNSSSIENLSTSVESIVSKIKNKNSK